MESSVTVTGVGQATVTPDQATVRLAAVQRAPGVGEAFAGVTATVEEIVQIASARTERRRVSTQDLVVWPAHDNQGQQVGWECRHSLSVVVEDLAAAGALVTALADQVGERMVIDGVGLSVSDPGAALISARAGAMADARQRAEQYAEAAGSRLGQVLRINEGGSDSGPVMESGGFAGARMMSMKDASLEPGERLVSSSATVTWALL